MSRQPRCALFAALITAVIATGCRPSADFDAELVSLYAASMGCVSFAPEIRQRDCAGVPALVTRIRHLPAMREPEAAHNFIDRELEARMYFAQRANLGEQEPAQGRGAVRQHVITQADANIHNGLALIESDLAIPGHGHAVVRNLDFLHEAVRHALAHGAFDQIDPWRRHIRDALRGADPTVAASESEPDGEREFSRLLGLAAQIETAWQASFIQRAEQASQAGDQAAADRYARAAAESQRAADWMNRESTGDMGGAALPDTAEDQFGSKAAPAVSQDTAAKRSSTLPQA